MSINFLDITYVIIFSLVQCSTAMVWKSPKYYISRYIKKPLQTTFYIHNPYKARKNLDYQYRDWDDKPPDIYDYLLPTTKRKPRTAPALIIFNTGSQETFRPEAHKPILETFPYSSLYNSYPTYSALPSNESIPENSLLTPSIDSTLPSSESTPKNSSPNPSIDSTLPSIESTPKNSSPNPSIDSTLPSNESTPKNSSPTPSNDSTPLSNSSLLSVVMDPESESIKEELEEAKAHHRGGYFTASVYVLLKIIEKKKTEDIRSLFIGLQNEINGLNSTHQLAIFGPMISPALTYMIQEMAIGPSELIQIQAKNGQDLINNKRPMFQTDIKAFFDVVDAIYIEKDKIGIIQSLSDIKQFPNIPKRGSEVAGQTMDAFIFVPYSRIQGTTKEKLLLMEMTNVVKKRMIVKEFVTERPYIRNHFKMATIMTSSPPKYTGKGQVRNAFVSPTLYTDSTTMNSSEKDYTSYIKGFQFWKRLRNKNRIYKYKFRHLRAAEKKMKMKRRLTVTTTTTIATSEMPQMHKNKNYMKKYIQKKKYKIKISTQKTTRITWRYGTDTIKSITPTKLKNNIIKDEESKMEKEDNNKIQRFDNKPDSSESNAEAYLKINLNDALFHTNNITINRRFITKKVNKLHKMDSFSDDETIFKSNIYKVFGYSNDFAKQLRAIKI